MIASKVSPIWFLIRGLHGIDAGVDDATVVTPTAGPGQEPPRRGYRVVDMLNEPHLPMYGDRTLVPPHTTSSASNAGPISPISNSSTSHHNTHGYHPYPQLHHHQYLCGNGRRRLSGYVTAPVSVNHSPTQSRSTSPIPSSSYHNFPYSSSATLASSRSRRSAPTSPRLPTTAVPSPRGRYHSSHLPSPPSNVHPHSHLAHSVRVAFGMTPLHPNLPPVSTMGNTLGMNLTHASTSSSRKGSFSPLPVEHDLQDLDLPPLLSGSRDMKRGAVYASARAENHVGDTVGHTEGPLLPDRGTQRVPGSRVDLPSLSSLSAPEVWGA